MRREYYSASITDFLEANIDAILGELAGAYPFALDTTQKTAWLEQIRILKHVLVNHNGRIYFEYAIPRMSKRIDVVLIIGPVIFVLEFKVGESHYNQSALDQVTDYCLDLKNFHETSLNHFIAPVLIATASRNMKPIVCLTPKNDKLLWPICGTVTQLGDVIDKVLQFSATDSDIDVDVWERGRYCPTPTIIEAALALYKGHSVTDISRNDASAINLSLTSEAISEIIRYSRDKLEKSICFLTGVPGAGKTLVGLNIATQHRDETDRLYSVFLSGNGPLVAILREALALDHVEHELAQGRRIRKGEARSKVKSFIQNVHNFRDECLIDRDRPPVEHVALFDEAQRAWTLEQTSTFMRQKKGVAGFDQSEPAFLISCLDRHREWAVIVCLVGGGQEINTGEAGISEWFKALDTSFPDWKIYISSRLTDSEYGVDFRGPVETASLPGPNARPVTASRPIGKSVPGAGATGLPDRVVIKDELHLSVSMRSFRAENVSHLVKQLLDLDVAGARETLAQLNEKYPIVITRDLTRVKQWLKNQARGSERYGIVCSSQAERLKPHAIDVRTKVDPVDWFLAPKHDVRSSYYLEDVATEFSVQGLELDWVCVAWDADFRYTRHGWEHWKFHGSRWKHIQLAHRQQYLKNAYRVLLTRARQGMVIIIPMGDLLDPTRKPDFYDATFGFLMSVGFRSI